MIVINNIDEYVIDFNYEKEFRNIYKMFNKLQQLKINRNFVVNFVSSQEIKKINFQYRKKNSVTDVITFCFDETQPNSPVLGELYICIPQAIKQAKEFNHSFKRELCFLYTHGLLHLFGYNHIDEKDASIMFSLQEMLLSKVKILRNSND